MKIHRFYLKESPNRESDSSELSTLDQDLIHQWRNVLRFAPGDVAELFTSEGVIYSVKLKELTKKISTWEILKTAQKDTQNQNVSLYLSVIKKDNFELVTQKVTEIGVAEIVPVVAARSQYKSLNQDRLEKITIEATEQSGGVKPPVVQEVMTLEQALNRAQDSDQRIVIFEFDGVSFDQAQEESSLPIALFVGPEGGWSDEDRELFDTYSVTKVSLGKKVLRAETAAIVGVWEFGK